jgi:hypothetical protein
MTATQIRASEPWKAKVQGRLKLLDEMTSEERAAFARLMNHTFPER